MQKGIMIAIVVLFVVSIVVSILASSGIDPRPPEERISTGINQHNQELTVDPLGAPSAVVKKGSLEGTIERLSPGMSEEGTHVLKAAGVTLSLLEAKDSSVNLDKYAGLNVQVTGTSRMTQLGDGSLMVVELVKVK